MQINQKKVSGTLLAGYNSNDKRLSDGLVTLKYDVYPEEIEEVTYDEKKIL